MNEVKDNNQLLKEDLIFAWRYLRRKGQWNRKLLDKLLFRKYANKSNRLEQAQQDFQIQSQVVQLSPYQKKLVLIKRMLAQDYRLISDNFQRTTRSSCIDCGLCGYPKIVKFYNIEFTDSKTRAKRYLKVGHECYKSVKHVLKQNAQIERNQNTNA